MHVFDPSISHVSSMVIPPSRQGDEDDEQLLQLADELSEREGIPVEAAWSIVSRHHSPSVTGGTYGS